jgi:hypothetical protein
MELPLKSPAINDIIRSCFYVIGIICPLLQRKTFRNKQNAGNIRSGKPFVSSQSAR